MTYHHTTINSRKHLWETPLISCHFADFYVMATTYWRHIWAHSVYSTILIFSEEKVYKTKEHIYICRVISKEAIIWAYKILAMLLPLCRYVFFENKRDNTFNKTTRIFVYRKRQVIWCKVLYIFKIITSIFVTKCRLKKVIVEQS